MSENNISVDRDFAGTLHIKVGDFDYIQIQYQYPHTDNASTRALADRIVSLLAQPAEADSFQIARHSKRLVEQLRSALSAVTAERDRLANEVLETELRALKFMHQCNAHVDLYRELKAERDQLKAEVEALRMLAAECNDYLNFNELTNIANGSILHRKLADAAMAAKEGA